MLKKYFFTLTPDTELPIRVPEHYSIFASREEAERTDYSELTEALSNSRLTSIKFDSTDCVELYTDYMGMSVMYAVDYCKDHKVPIRVMYKKDDFRIDSFQEIFLKPLARVKLGISASLSLDESYRGFNQDELIPVTYEQLMKFHHFTTVRKAMEYNLYEYKGTHIDLYLNRFDNDFVTACQVCSAYDIALTVHYVEPGAAEEAYSFNMYFEKLVMNVIASFSDEDDPDEEEDCSDIKFVYYVFHGVVVVNTTPHSIRFQDENGFLVDLLSTEGYIINASVEEEPVSPLLVRTTYKGNEEGWNIIKEIEAFFENHFGTSRGYTLAIVGSVIAAQAYPGRVVSMCPVPGYERVAPSEKRMRSDKFVTFG